MKDTLIETKNNLQGNSSRMYGGKNQINDLEHKEAKTTNQNNKKKKESKTPKDRPWLVWLSELSAGLQTKGLPV